MFSAILRVLNGCVLESRLDTDLEAEVQTRSGFEARDDEVIELRAGDATAPECEQQGDATDDRWQDHRQQPSSRPAPR